MTGKIIVPGAPVSPARQGTGKPLGYSYGREVWIGGRFVGRAMSTDNATEIARAICALPPSVSGGLPAPSERQISNLIWHETGMSQSDAMDLARKIAALRAAAPEAERREPEP